MKNIATPFHRIVAHAIDIALMVLIYFLFLSRLASVNTLSNLLTQIIWTFIYLAGIGLVFNLLNIFLTVKVGGSVGKIICGLKVVNSDGSNISLKKAFFRNFVGYALSSLILGLGYWWVFKDKNRQTWHDQFVNTYVTTRASSAVAIGLLALVILLACSTYVFAAAANSVKQNLPFYKQTVTDISEDVQKNLTPSPTPEPTSMPRPTQTQARPSIQPQPTKITTKRPATTESDIINTLSSAFNGTPLKAYVFHLQNKDGSPADIEGYSSTLSTTPGVVDDYFTKTGFTKIDAGWTKNSTFCTIINTTASTVEVACIPF